MNGRKQQAQPTVRRATPDLLYIPLVPFVTVGVAALLIGIVAKLLGGRIAARGRTGPLSSDWVLGNQAR